MSLVLVMIYEDVFRPNNNEVMNKRKLEYRVLSSASYIRICISISLTKPHEPHGRELHKFMHKI